MSNNNTKITKEQWKEREFGALWVKKSGAGAKYLTGTVDGRKVVVFPSKNKLNENQPDFRIYLSEDRPQSESAAPAKPMAKLEPKKVATVSDDDEEGIF